MHTHTAEFPNNGRCACVIVTEKIVKNDTFSFFTAKMSLQPQHWFWKRWKPFFFSFLVSFENIMFFYVVAGARAHILNYYCYDYGTMSCDLTRNGMLSVCCVVCVCITRREWLKHRWKVEDIRSHCYGIQASFNHGQRSSNHRSSRAHTNNNKSQIFSIIAICPTPNCIF